MAGSLPFNFENLVKSSPTSNLPLVQSPIHSSAFSHILFQVMRKLKQALQPSIDNVSIEWRVPSADVVQIPTEIPTVFASSRLIVFGVPKLASGSKDMQADCEAILHYQQGKERKSLSVYFTLPPSEKEPIAGDVDSYPIHRLAGKQLLQEVAKKTDKEELVRVSLETGVMCKETAFVAIAEDGEEAVTGALEKQAISVPTRSRLPRGCTLTKSSSRVKSSYSQLAQAQCPLEGRGSRCSRVKSSYGQPAQFQRPLEALGSSSPQAKSSRHRSSGVSRAPTAAGAWVGRCPSKSMAAASDMDVQSATGVASCEGALGGVNGSFDSAGDFEKEEKADNNESACAATSLPTKKDERQSALPSGVGHLAVISLQQFSGVWHLNEALAKICGRPLADLQSSQPASLSSLSDKESMWATLLAVVLLKHRHGDAEEEWELVVEKAMSWLKGCLASTSESVDELLKIAKSML